MFGLAESTVAWVVGILLLVCLALGGTCYALHAHNETLSTKLDAATVAADAAQRNEKANKTASDEWQALAEKRAAALADAQTQLDGLRTENAQAVAAANARAASSQAQLAAFRTRYANAAKGACGKILDTPVCVEALPQ